MDDSPHEDLSRRRPEENARPVQVSRTTTLVFHAIPNWDLVLVIDPDTDTITAALKPRERGA